MATSIDGLCAACLMQLAELDPPSPRDGDDEGGATSDRDRPLPPSHFDDWLKVRGRHIGNYELLEEIARGGMGIVYRARQLTAGRAVALKVMLPHLLHLPGMLQRFRHEVEAAAQLDHPGILPIYEVGEHVGLPYFSMKLAEGGALEKRLSSYHGEWKTIAVLVAKVARAVEHAHRRGILHRDLKPANVLFDANGEPLVADFGLAKFRALDRSVTLPTSALGSPNYMAPEQISAQFGEVCPATDVYGLGAVLYELLTGEPPIVGEDALTIMRLVSTQQPPSGVHTRPDLPADLDAIALKCLAKRSSQRYASAEELALDLERWIEGGEALARRQARSKRRRRWGLHAGAGALAVAALAGGFALINLSGRPSTGDSGATAGDAQSRIQPAAHARTLLVLPFETDGAGAGQEYMSAGLTEEVINTASRIGGLHVIGRTSSYRFRELRGQIDHQALGIDIDYELQGTVQQTGGRLLIAARILDARTNGALQEKTYDLASAQLSDVPGRIAKDLAAELQLVPPAPSPSGARHTPKPEAYRLLLEGRAYSLLNTPGGFEQAIDHLQQATAADPDFALAHAAIAIMHMLRVDFGAVPLDEATRAAEPSARRALALDPELAESQSALGLIDFYNGNLDSAAAAFRRSTSLRANYTQGHMWLGRLLFQQGSINRACVVLRRTYELEPLSPIVAINLFRALEAAGRLEEAQRVAERNVTVNPWFAGGYWTLARIDHVGGRMQEARRHFTRAVEHAAELGPAAPTLLADYAQLLLQLGEAGGAAAALNKAEAMNPDDVAVLAARLDWLAATGSLAEFRNRVIDDLSTVTSRPAALMVAARAAYQTGNAAEARRLFDAVATSGEDAASLMRDQWEAWAGRSALIEHAAATLESGDGARGKELLDEAEAFLIALRRQGWDSGGLDYLQATVHALRGDRKRALAYLENPLIRYQPGAWWVAHDRRTGALRNQPQFRAIVARLASPAVH